jgi:hypothetical protein
MKKTLAALAVLAVPSLAMAAPSTCYDLLVRTPERTYSCTGTMEPDTPFFSSMVFSPSMLGPPAFTVTYDSGLGGTALSCLCDSTGSASKPKFHAAKRFTCGLGEVDNAATIRGKVGGKDGDKITGFQLGQVSPFPPTTLGLIGSCELLP